MKGKIILPAVCSVGLLAALLLSPIGVSGAMSSIVEWDAQASRVAAYERNLDTVNTMLTSAVSDFNNERTFDVSYTDVPKLNEVLQNVAGIEVQDIVKIDPTNGFIESGTYQEGDQTSAVKFNLLTSEPATALSVLQKLQLPVYSVYWEAPNTLSIVFLTGGAV